MRDNMKAKSYYKLNTKGDTLKISKLAREHRLADETVVNATVGSLYDEQHVFYEYEAVKKAIHEGPTAYPYKTSEGDPEVARKWLEHLFEAHTPKQYQAMITNGGTGALSLAMDTYLEPGDIVLSGVPDWTNYQNLVEHGKHQYITFPLFNDQGVYNVEALESLLNQYIGQRIMIMINDPAQNPTGYSMDKKIWQRVFDCINTYNQERNIILLIDCAYIDYAEHKTIALELLKTQDIPVMTLLVISGSKSFSIYGARIGMLAALSHDDEELASFKEASLYAARGTYSLPSNFGMNVLSHVFKHHETFINELQSSKHMLQLRGIAFKALLDEKNIKYYPQHDGFFVTLISEDPFDLFEQLKAKKIYAIPVEKGVRVALSSMSLEDIQALHYIL